jgi:hypothetical protein
MLHRLEATGPARRAELRLGLLGMVVVRDHDCSMWAIDKPESHRGIDGCVDPNDGVYLRVPIFTEFRRFDSCGE